MRPGKSPILFINACEAGYHTHGTDFMIAKSLVGNVIRFTAVSNRLCVLPIISRFGSISIVNAYAPTEILNNNKDEEFYDHLQR